MSVAVSVTVTVAPDAAPGRLLLAPVGMATPHLTPVRFAVEGAACSLAHEATTGQTAALIAPEPAAPVTLAYDFADGGPGYPEALFVARDNRYTRAAADLAGHAKAIAAEAGGGFAAIAAIVADAAGAFTYGHPDRRFNDGLDAVPQLACGLAEGSCVDINTYLIAALRAAGFEAGYVTGYFFPAEKRGCCDDMHCWVVSRHQGEILEWDIAHHLKLGAAAIRPGLNPKPGERVALAHSMGLDFPALGIAAMKLIAEPVWIDAAGREEKAAVTIRMRRPAAESVAAE